MLLKMIPIEMRGRISKKVFQFFLLPSCGAKNCVWYNVFYSASWGIIIWGIMI